MKAYQAYYKVKPTFLEDEELSVAKVTSRMGKHFVPVKILLARDLDDVYSKMQGERWSPNGEARPLIEALGLTHTSMSAGDVIHDIEAGVFYEVAWRGFRELPMINPKIKKELEEIGEK